MTQQRGSIAIIFLLIILVLSGFIVGGAFYIKSQGLFSPKTSNTQTEVSTTTKSIPKVENPSPIASSSAQPIVAKDCGVETVYTPATSSATPNYPHLSCFITASQSCTTAKITLTENVFALIGTASATINYNLNKNADGKCALSLKESQVSFKTDPSTPETAKLSLSGFFNQFNNTEGSCLYTNNSDIAKAFQVFYKNTIGFDINSNSQNSSASSTFPGGQCSGTYFNLLNKPDTNSLDSSNSATLESTKLTQP